MKNDLFYIKCAGGKRQLLEQYKPYFPKKIERYFDPFLGGGAIAFYIIQKYKPREVYLSDSNAELVNYYNILKTDVEALIDDLWVLKLNHGKDQYYNVRSLNPNNLSLVERAARFVYLNKTCFNGLYRENLKGEFNVPIGSYKNPSIFTESELRDTSELLQDVPVLLRPFDDVVLYADKDDFVYFDPPYYPIIKGKSFTSYTKNSFLGKEQEQLAWIFRFLDEENKSKVMLSNSDTEFVRGLYSMYNIHVVSARRSINCNGMKRGTINELLITNY
jgi:DNA adenine methylase